MADCSLANPDVFEIMTGWVTMTQEEKCLLAFPNNGSVKHPTINVAGRRLRLVVLETISLHAAKPRSWQKLIRMKSQDEAVQVELRYRVAKEECNPETSCYAPKYGELTVTNGVERFVVSVQQRPV
jgi:hypothetical protein